MSERIFFSGKTVEQAVMSAATHHGLKPEEIEYHEVKKRSGFTKTPRGVVIRVDPLKPSVAPGVSAVASSADAVRAPETPVLAASGAGLRPAAPVELPAVRPGDEPSEAGARERFETERVVEEREVVATPGRVSRREDAARDADEETDEDADEEEADDEDDSDEDEDEDEDDREDEDDDESYDDDEEDDEEADDDEEDDDEADDEEEELSEADSELVAAAERWLNRLLSLSQLELEAEIWPGSDGLEIELFGEDESVVVEEEGQILRSLQHLLPRLLHTDAGRLVHCRVDCDNYQEDREQELQDLAERVAREVLAKGRPKTLRPMHPADRRVVHLALADDPDVTTESVGDGYFKRVMIKEG